MQVTQVVVIDTWRAGGGDAICSDSPLHAIAYLNLLQFHGTCNI